MWLQVNEKAVDDAGGGVGRAAEILAGVELHLIASVVASPTEAMPGSLSAVVAETSTALQRATAQLVEKLKAESARLRVAAFQYARADALVSGPSHAAAGTQPAVGSVRADRGQRADRAESTAYGGLSDPAGAHTGGDVRP